MSRRYVIVIHLSYKVYRHSPRDLASNESLQNQGIPIESTVPSELKSSFVLSHHEISVGFQVSFHHLAHSWSKRSPPN